MCVCSGGKGVPLSHRRFATRMSTTRKPAKENSKYNMPDRMMASESIHYMSNSSTLNSKWKTKTATTTHPLLAVSNSHEQSDTASPNEIDKDEGAVANDRSLEMD